ncbi:uncharacterized protein LOC143620780 [Bidens hawaiensis]|uniref:uncharacterized protein LOC143620780 n=1 Tax=Bidens hawaiensis TaxID=980011 RepID=UPI00404A8BE7
MPFNLTYGTEALIPAEIGVPSVRTLLTIENEKELRLNLDLFKERRELASIKERKYIRQLQKYYNSRVNICKFKVGDYVFWRNEASNAEPGKLAPTWEGPYKIHAVLDKGSYKLEKN